MKKNPTKTFNNDYVLLEKNNQKKNWILKTVSWVLLNLRYDLTLTRNLYEKQVLLFYIRGNLKLFSFTALFKKKNYHPKDGVILAVQETLSVAVFILYTLQEL